MQSKMMGCDVTGVAIVILNWNNWPDTIECLASVFKIDYPDFKVIVVDNGSDDGSVDRIIEWSQGYCQNWQARPSRSPLADSEGLQPVICPVLYQEADYERELDSKLLIMKLKYNLGFAGGNNVALRYLMKQKGIGYVWLLNNDTVVAQDALSALVSCMESSQMAGMCGSTLPYYDRPDIIWAQGGGSFNRWLARSECLGNGLPLAKGLEREDVERRMKYVAGASMLVSREFIEETGLMCEDYFLYFEEPDWAFRGQHRFRLAYAPESIVYHKVGMSTCKGFQPKADIGTPDYYIFLNSLRFTRKFLPIALPIVFIRVSFNFFKAWFIGRLFRMLNSYCG